MNHTTFMQAGLERPQKRSRRFGSLYRDSNNVFYSYGTHYPLLWEVNGQYFVNDAGYSISTSKHIGCAFHAAKVVTGKDAMPVDLSFAPDNFRRHDTWRESYASENLTADTLAALKNERKHLLKEIKTISKRAYRQRCHAVNRLLIVENSMASIGLRYQPFFTAREEELWKAVTGGYWQHTSSDNYHKIRAIMAESFQDKDWTGKNYTSWRCKRLNKFTLEEISLIGSLAGVKYQDAEALRIWELL